MNTSKTNLVDHVIILHRKRWFRGVVQIGIWGLLGVFFTFQSYTYRLNAGVPDTRWWDLLPREMTFFMLWAAATPIIVRVARRFPFSREFWLQRLLLHTGFGLVVAICQRMLDEGIDLNLETPAGTPFPWDTFWNHTIGFADYGYFLYCIIILVVYGYDLSRKLYDERVAGSRLREELALAQVNALKMQLQPHFLFNTLNTIAILIREEPDQAETTVGLLSDLLRLTLQQSGEQEISLRREIEFVSKYLEIEQIRFGDRLTVTIEMPTALEEALVPALVLQPLAENAVRHGIAKRREPGRIRIAAEQRDGFLYLSVQDNGVGVDPAAESSGIGLSNTRSRLKSLYSDDAHLEIIPAEGEGTIVRLSLPYKSSRVLQAEDKA